MEKLEIKLSNIGFKYNNSSKVLDDVSLTMSPEKIFSFVVESGSGKSTLVKLLCRF